MVWQFRDDYGRVGGAIYGADLKNAIKEIHPYLVIKLESAFSAVLHFCVFW